MESNGLVKLAEECGELIQAAMKKIARSDGENVHWDGSNLKERLEDEIADVIGSCNFVIAAMELDEGKIFKRSLGKLELFRYWHNGGTEIAIPTAATDGRSGGE